MENQVTMELVTLAARWTELLKEAKGGRNE